MVFSFGLPVPEQQIADAAHFLLELISKHGHEAIRLSRGSDLPPCSYSRTRLLWGFGVMPPLTCQ
jgi:hypothetical protein